MKSVQELLRVVAAYGLPSAAGHQVPHARASLDDSQHHKPGSREALDDAAWAELVSHAQWQRITNLLTLTVAAGTIPATAAQRAQAIEVDEAEIASALRLEALLLDVGDIFDQAEVRFRVLKGPAVAHLDYPDPSWRGFGDIDLLVPSDGFDRVIAALQSAGFTRRFPQPRQGFDRRFTKSVSLERSRGEQVDLHRTLAGGGFGQRIIVSMLWAAPASTFEVGGRTFTALGPEERLAHACYHATLGNSPPRLAPLRDIAEMLLNGNLATDRALVLAKAWRGQAVLAHAITTAWDTLGLERDVPLRTWAAAFGASKRDLSELARATSPSYSFPAQAVDQLRAIRGTRERLAYASALAFPQRTYIAGRHPGFVSRARRAVAGVRLARTSHRGEP